MSVNRNVSVVVGREYCSQTADCRSLPPQTPCLTASSSLEGASRKATETPPFLRRRPGLLAGVMEIFLACFGPFSHMQLQASGASKMP